MQWLRAWAGIFFSQGNHRQSNLWHSLTWCSTRILTPASCSSASANLGVSWQWEFSAPAPPVLHTGHLHYITTTEPELAFTFTRKKWESAFDLKARKETRFFFVCLFCSFYNGTWTVISTLTVLCTQSQEFHRNQTGIKGLQYWKKGNGKAVCYVLLLLKYTQPSSYQDEGLQLPASTLFGLTFSCLSWEKTATLPFLPSSANWR